MAASRKIDSLEQYEYDVWVHEVVVPGILAISNGQQRDAFAKKGLEVIRG